MRSLAFLCLLFAAPTLAETPRVAADIGPVHSLVRSVMAGAGEPDLILPPGASPHGYAMRPSEARALSAADLVVWVGPALSPWLAEPVETLAPEAVHLEVMDLPGLTLLPFRTGEMFAGGHDGHDHGAHDGHGDEAHGHEDHAEHGHDEHDHGEKAHKDHAHHEGAEDAQGHDDHAEDVHEAASHDHDDHGHDDHAHDEHADLHDDDHADHASGVDPHVWLDPRNGILILEAVAEALAALDPENAALYRENAAAEAARIETLELQIAAQLRESAPVPFVVAHDAYHYFEARFDRLASGAISFADDAEARPAHLAELRDRVTELDIACVLAEPQSQLGLISAVFEGGAVRVETIDMMGVDLGTGPDLYTQILSQTAEALTACGRE
ncbi:zinc ABC transporter substrate-binding protein [uncultured Roseobacter sp.]|uniref:zinc ABC transporter substrate-binding protein n=1 Tax=uncultured Roseobacter sp. TaxID=114847 RepID=UPI002612FF6D|nr:zinc ABC transporter substrate-binding protein [uncultured Roseobacter sp.]